LEEAAGRQVPVGQVQGGGAFEDLQERGALGERGSECGELGVLGEAGGCAVGLGCGFGAGLLGKGGRDSGVQRFRPIFWERGVGWVTFELNDS